MSFAAEEVLECELEIDKKNAMRGTACIHTSLLFNVTLVAVDRRLSCKEVLTIRQVDTYAVAHKSSEDKVT